LLLSRLMLKPRHLGRIGLAALAAVFATASSSSAARLFTSVASMQAPGMPGSEGETLMLDQSALDALRASGRGSVEDFPMGGGTVSLELARTDAFGSDTVVRENGRVVNCPSSGAMTFVGTVKGDAGGRAVLVAGPDFVHGFVKSKGVLYGFGPDGRGGHRGVRASGASAGGRPHGAAFCGNDAHPEPATSPRGRHGADLGMPSALPSVTPDTTIEVRIGIEADLPLWTNASFHDTCKIAHYADALVTTANALYQEFNVHLRIGYVHVCAPLAPGDHVCPWTTPHKPTNADPRQEYQQQKDELAAKYAAGTVAPSSPVAVVHMLSGIFAGTSNAYREAGFSHVGGLCHLGAHNSAGNSIGAFGISQVDANLAFDLSPTDDPYDADIWDGYVFSHEVAHALGTQHTHCYNPPLDHCFNKETTVSDSVPAVQTACYRGPSDLLHGVDDPLHGTMMSYCTLLDGGWANLDVMFGSTVASTLRQQVAQALDDPACQDAQNPAQAPIHVVGACPPGTDPSTTDCLASTCGDGVVDASEQCDDGNTTAGDGCSANCSFEPCHVAAMAPGTTPTQTAWAKTRFVASTSKTFGDSLSVKGTLRLAPDSTIVPEQNGMRIMILSHHGAVKLDQRLPSNATPSSTGRPFWSVHPSTKGTTWKFFDTDAFMKRTGIYRVDVKLYPSSAGPLVKTAVRGHTAAAGPYAFKGYQVPPSVTVVFGNDADGQNGLCGLNAFVNRCFPTASSVSCR
jgi:cysteine-rich repeat protein